MYNISDQYRKDAHKVSHDIPRDVIQEYPAKEEKTIQDLIDTNISTGTKKSFNMIDRPKIKFRSEDFGKKPINEDYTNKSEIKTQNWEKVEDNMTAIEEDLTTQVVDSIDTIVKDQKKIIRR